MCLPNLHLSIGIDSLVDSANYNVSVVRVTAYENSKWVNILSPYCVGESTSTKCSVKLTACNSVTAIFVLDSWSYSDHWCVS